MIILCSFSTVGRNVANLLKKDGAEFIIIDPRKSVMEAAGANFILGEPFDEEVLVKAGISKARTLIACAEKDSINSFVALSAKALNPNISIFTIVRHVSSIEKMYKAGADLVISESQIGGRLLAKHAVSPHVAEFINRITLTKNVEITELNIHKGSELVGKQIKDSNLRESTGITILGIEKDGNILLNPPATIRLETGNVLLAMGTSSQIKETLKILRP